MPCQNPPLLRSFVMLLIFALAQAFSLGDVLVRNGDFVGAEGKKIPGWEVAGDWVQVEARQENGEHFVRIRNTNPQGVHNFSQTIDLPPLARTLLIVADMRSNNIQPANHPWETARVNLQFLDEEGRNMQIHGAAPILTEPTDGWQRISVVREVPDGARSLRLQPGIWLGIGEVDFKHIRVDVTAEAQPPVEIPEPELLTDEQIARILPPSLRRVWREATPTSQGEHRATLDLSGYWLFAPGSELPEQEEGWGLLRVPASWRPPPEWAWNPPTGWQRSTGNPFVMRGGKSPAWQDFNSINETEAWYARAFIAPETWQTGRVLLQLQRVGTDATVFVNGRIIEEVIAAHGGQVDITEQIEPGRLNTIHVYVRVLRPTGRARRLMGTGTDDVVDTTVANRGLVGEVTLHHQPRQRIIESAWVETSVVNRELTLRLQAAAAIADAEIDIKAIISDWRTGEQVAQFTGQIAPGDSGNVAELHWNWPDARLWSPENPHLYQLALMATHNDMQDSDSIRFGFREFEIRGRDFYLNDQLYKLRPFGQSLLTGLTLDSGFPVSREMIRTYIRERKDLNGNLLQFWPSNPLARGAVIRQQAAAQIADEEGLLIAGVMPHLEEYLNDWGGLSPAGWSWPDWATRDGFLSLLTDDAGNRTVQFRTQSIQAANSIVNTTELQPEWTTITVYARVQADFEQVGEQPRSGAGVNLRFRDAAGQDIDSDVNSPYLGETSQGWTTMQAEIPIPSGARQLAVSPGVWRAAGIVQFDKIMILADGETELSFNGAFQKLHESDARQRLQQDAMALIADLRNHPSIVLWGSSANLFGSPLEPWVIGKREEGMRNFPAWSRHRRDPGSAAIEVLSSVDRTRPVYTHHGGAMGAIFTSNFYFNFTPLQDKMEWLTEWRENGDMPYWIVEFGNPYTLSFRRDRDGHTNSDTSEPWVTEFTAMYLGPEAYELETAEYRNDLVENYRPGDDGHRWRFRRPPPQYQPAVQELVSEHHRKLFLSWRTLGASMLPLPWSQGMGLQARGFPVSAYHASAEQMRLWMNDAPVELNMAVKELRVLSGGNGYDHLPTMKSWSAALQPAQAYLGGPARLPKAWSSESPETVTSQAANIYASSPVERSLVVLNDLPNPADYEIEVTVRLQDREAPWYQETFRGEVESASNQLIAVEFGAPELACGQFLQGEIVMAGKVGPSTVEDRRPLYIFAPARDEIEGLALYDPAGTTAELLEKLGLSWINWQPGNAFTSLVIGREALAHRPTLLSELAPSIEAGARVLMLEPSPTMLADSLGFRIAHRIARLAFPVLSNSEIATDLPPGSLRNWVGVSTLVEPYPKHDQRHPETRYGGWRWGGRGGVSSASVEKPHFSAWRPILQNEFDLAYSPLLELPVGQGRIVLSTLDLTDHAGQDPAAEIMLRRLLQHLNAPVTEFAAARPVHALVDETWTQRLDEAGLILTDHEVPNETSLILVGRQLTPDELQTIRDLATAGATIVYLPDTAIPDQWNVRRETLPAYTGTREPPRLSALRGLDVSELRWRAPHAADVLVGDAEIDAGGMYAEKSIGSGRVVFLQFNPWHIDTDQHFYLRFTKWRQARAWSQVLANLGARFEYDAALFARPPAEAPTERLELAGQWQAHPTGLVPATMQEKADPGISEKARAIIDGDTDQPRAEARKLPQPWKEFGGQWSDRDGEAVFETTVTIPDEWSGRELILSLGVLDDFDSTHVNGVEVGATGQETARWWATPRLYTIPAELAGQRELRITVRVWCRWQAGGFMGSPEDLFIMPVSDWQAAKARQQAATEERDFYHPDYIEDFKTGDNPYRYYNW